MEWKQDAYLEASKEGCGGMEGLQTCARRYSCQGPMYIVVVAGFGS